MTLRVLVAPSGFKESLGAEEVADYIEAGVLRALPGAEITKAPMVDGGEGFTRALVEVTGGTLHPMVVTGPVGEPVEAHFGFLGEVGDGPRTAVLEMAAAAGLRLVPRGVRDPSNTTTYGVGELIRAALDAGRRASSSVAGIRARATAARGWRRLSAYDSWTPKARSWGGVGESLLGSRVWI